MRFNPQDYATVEERLTEFWNAHPDGRIWTELVRLEPPLVVFRAEVYREHTDANPAAVGYAYEKEGAGGPVNKTSYIENCETSAVGRALANLGLHGKKGAPRPSREEMEKVARMEERNAGVMDEVSTLLKSVDGMDVDAKTQKVLDTIAEQHRAGNAAFLERSLDWLRDVAGGADAVKQMEGVA